MFESFEKNHVLDYEEYRQELYRLRHPDEYPGDYEEFKRQVTEVSSKLYDRNTVKQDQN